MSGEFRVLPMPLNYNADDLEVIRSIKRKMAEYEAEYRNKCQPLLEELVRIDAKYPQRYQVMPSL